MKAEEVRREREQLQKEQHAFKKSKSISKRLHRRISKNSGPSRTDEIQAMQQQLSSMAQAPFGGPGLARSAVSRETQSDADFVLDEGIMRAVQEQMAKLRQSVKQAPIATNGDGSNAKQWCLSSLGTSHLRQKLAAMGMDSARGNLPAVLQSAVETRDKLKKQEWALAKEMAGLYREYADVTGA